MLVSPTELSCIEISNFPTHYGGHLEKLRNTAWPEVDYELGWYKGYLCQIPCLYDQLWIT